MYRPLSRRVFSRSTLVLPLALLAGTRVDAQPVNALGAVIGGTHSAFDAEYGTSREESGFTVYDFSHTGQASYWVRFDASGYAEYIEVDFTDLPGSGLDFTADTVGVSRFVPADATFFDAEGHGGNALSSALNIKQYTSAQLATATGRSGNLIVVDDYKLGPNGLAGPMIIERTYVSLEAWEVHPVVGHGIRPGVGDPIDMWRVAYGSVLPAQSGWYLDTPPLPGSWSLNFQGGETGATTSIDIRLDTPISSAEAARWVSDMIRFGSPTSTYWLPPTPGGPIGIRIHVFNSSLDAYVFSAQYVRGGEQTGTVDRMMIFASSPPMVY